MWGRDPELLSVCGIPVIDLGRPQSPAFLALGTGFVKDSIYLDGGGSGMIQVRHFYRAVYFDYYCVSSTPDLQTSDPRAWGPVL